MRAYKFEATKALYLIKCFVYECFYINAQKVNPWFDDQDV